MEVAAIRLRRHGAPVEATVREIRPDGFDAPSGTAAPNAFRPAVGPFR